MYFLNFLEYESKTRWWRFLNIDYLLQYFTMITNAIMLREKWCKHSDMTQVLFNVTCRYGGTNIRNALNQAVSLRQPIYAFPVTDLNTLMSHSPQLKRDQPGVLTECISLKPGSTVDTCFSLMKFHYHTLKGDFVRCEVSLIIKTSNLQILHLLHDLRCLPHGVVCGDS